MVRIDIRYEGGLRCAAVHAPSGGRVLTDAPLDNQGKGESFSPTDLVATALGTCMLTIMGIVAQRHGVDLTDATVSVEKSMLSGPPRRIGRLTVEIRVPRDPGPQSRKLLEAAAFTCPVHASLDPAMEKPVTFHWGA